MRRWFLSYNSVDLPIVEQLEGRLRQQIPDTEIFFAPKALRAGGYWLPKLAEAIAEASAFILYVGENGLGPWQVIEYYEALDKRVKQPDFPVVLVLLDGKPAPGLPFLRQLHWIVTADPSSTDTIGKLKETAAGGGADRPGELWRYTAPYRGLAAMTEADSDFFFGREQQTVDVINAIGAEQERLAVLIGNSGVGKSSLAQAGILGALKRQAFPESTDKGTPWPKLFHDSRRWCFLKMQPGTEPIKALVEPFLKTWQFDPTDPKWEERRTDWISALSSGKATLSGLLDATERRYEELGQDKPPAFFLYVDQGEELYVRSIESQRGAFSKMLADAVADPRLYALMSLRSDFFGALQNDQSLFPIHSQINVPPLRESELSQVVSKPAALLSARFESDQLSADLARRAAEESAKDAGALPLLSYLLDDMWTDMVKRGDGVLRLPPQAMELGGVLAERADAFLARNPQAETTLRRLLTLKLATVREDGEPTRRRALRSEFSDEEWRMVSDLADHPHRLLVTATPEGAETYAEVAHEAIFKRWGKLREWVAAERDFLSWRTRVEADRRAWEAAPPHACNDALLMGLALAEAQGWLARRAEDLPRPDRHFIEKSIERELHDREEREKEREQRDRLRRRMLQVAVAALIIVTGLAGFSVYEMFEAFRQQQAANEQRAIAVQRQAEAEAQKAAAQAAQAAAEAAKVEAESQKARAERNFSAAKVAVDKLIFDVAGDLSTMAGMRVDTIRTILETVRSTIDQLAEAAPDDVELQRSRSAMFNMFVDTYLAAGDLNGALDAAEQGLKIARKLFADDPNNTRAERDVSISLERLGDVKIGAGDSDGALAAYQERLDFARRLLAKDPQNLQAKRDLSVSLNKVGDVKFRTGDSDGALAVYEEGLVIARELANKDPDNAEAGRDVSVSLTKVGDVKIGAGDFDAALKAYQEALDIRRKLSGQYPGNAQLLRDVSVSLNRLGDVQLKLKQNDKALASYAEGLDIARRLAIMDSGNAQAQRDLSVSLNKVGDMKLDAGDRKGAFDAYNESLGIARRLAKQDPGNATAQTDLVVSLTRLADVSDDPESYYLEALDILHALDAQGRLSPEQKGWIDWVNGRLADLKKPKGKGAAPEPPPPPAATTDAPVAEVPPADATPADVTPADEPLSPEEARANKAMVNKKAREKTN
jgi:tetratricopeptide (TPR) repeat protein